jgi:redox-sensitive bicupin YhaK (pirin superfamily)
MASVTKVSSSDLFVSEPSPAMFGNKKNEGSNPTWTNKNWLKSRFHFSFAEYHNHRNSNFGVLRVMNDDLVQPARGFGKHPHREMEIVTYVVEGNLTHEDSMGTSETLGSGSVQYMTAGSGIRHSEHNLDATKPLRFIQMWLVPRQRGLTPEYGSLASDGTPAPVNTWRWLVGDADSPDAPPGGSGEGPPIKIHTDANISVVTVSGDDDGAPLELANGRQAYFLTIDGAVQLLPAAGCTVDKPPQLERHDAAELRGPLSLRVVSTSKTTTAQVLMVEMQDDGSSRFK